MGCDVMLFRKEFLYCEEEGEMVLTKSELFWDVKSWKLGIAFSEMLGADAGLKSVCIDDFMVLCEHMISSGDDDYGEYPDVALKAFLEDLEKIDCETKSKSDWFITLDY